MPETEETLPFFRIAVLDDVPSTLTMTKMVLESQLDCEVKTYTSAEAILDLPPSDYPDLFLLDIVMEGMDGLELCRKLKQKPETAALPVIFLSAHGDCEGRVTALQAGGVDYIDKPFYPEELLARIRTQMLLHHSARQLRQQTAEQQALLRILCHDLRNPVAAVSSILELINDSPEEIPELLPLAGCSIQSALELIQHVRDYRNLVDEGQSYAGERVSVTDAFREVLTINQPRAREKGVHLKQEIEGDPHLIINRVVLVHNILNNLVSNAIKFSEPGGELFIRARPLPGDAGTILLQVEDTGIGMDAATVKHLFDPEKNRSREGTGKETGLGFGMPLVKRYVDLFHGRIEIDSRPKSPDSPEGGHGTRVDIHLTGSAN